MPKRVLIVPPVPLSGRELREQIERRCFDSAEESWLVSGTCILATVYFIVDGVFSYVTQPVSAWIAKKQTIRASANVGELVAALPVAGPFRRACRSPGAGQAFRGIFDRHRSFLRRCCYLHHGGSLEADLP